MTRDPRRRPIPDARLDETQPIPPVKARPKGSRTPAARIERVEERLVPKVSEVRAGDVQIRRRVVEEQEQVEVTLRHDELALERRKADRPLLPDEQPVTERGDTTIVLVIEERLQVRKVPWVVEEIHLTRGVVSERQQVADTVRKEKVDIDVKGDVELKHRD